MGARCKCRPWLRPRMRSALLTTAIPLRFLLVACVEQDDDKPTAEDMEAAKENILTTAPTPQVPGQRRPGRQGHLPRPRRRPAPGRARQGRQADPLLEGDRAARRGLEDVHPPRGRRTAQSYINADHAPVRGKYPVTQWKAGEIIRDEHVFRLPATWQHDGRGLHRPVARRRRACRSRRARTTPRAACWPRRSRSRARSRPPRRRRATWSARSPRRHQARRQARRGGLEVGARRRARS